ncbi:MAG TPA: hypothetical protein VEA99_06235 [Gemmatimonadaceae bacterium]|nr:hypothetical protein [Gemmatimonadaceae bacterium]
MSFPLRTHRAGRPTERPASRRAVRLSFVAAAIALIAACDDVDTAAPETPCRIALREPSSVLRVTVAPEVLPIGQTARVAVTAPAACRPMRVSVQLGGQLLLLDDSTVRAVSAGEARVTATSTRDLGISAFATVRVPTLAGARAD